jgi:arylsulfatase
MEPPPVEPKSAEPTGSKRRALLLIVILVVLGATLGSLQWARRAPQRSGKPDVIIITVDTLRKDHLSCYGYERLTSPNIDRLASDSITFTNAVVPMPLTLPSVACMFTGLYVYRHGIRHNFVQLHESLTTLAELLRENGYETAAFVSNYVLIRELSGVNQGFEVYDDFVSEREPNRDIFERRAENTLSRVLAWLDRRSADRPLFLWVHLVDPHGPYLPPAPYRARFKGGESKTLDLSQIPKYQYVGTVDLASYINSYDGEIAYCDEAVGRLVDALKEAGLYERALVLFNADHGESLGEAGQYFRHGQDLSEACVQVPLLLKLPQDHPLNGTRSEVLASVVDIMPPVLDGIGLPIPPELDGESLLQILKQGARADPVVLLERIGAKGGPPVVGIRTLTDRTLFYLDSPEDLTVMLTRFSELDESAEGRARRLPASKQTIEARKAVLAEKLELIRNYPLPFTPRDWRPANGAAFVEQRNAAGDALDWSRHQKALKSLGYVE